MPQSSVTQQTNDNIPLALAILLFLFPGVLTVIGFLALQKLFPGLPSSLNFLLSTLLVSKPVTWAYLLYKGYQKNGKLSLKGIIRFREKMPIWQYIVFFVGGTVLAFGILSLLSPVPIFLMHHIFWWFPKALIPGDLIDKTVRNRSLILLTILLDIVIDGVVAPVTEEVFNRGYLMPRLRQLGAFAPLVTAFLFTIQHFWQPQNYALIFTLQIVLCYLVWWKRNINISIMLHSFTNTLGGVITLISFLR